MKASATLHSFGFICLGVCALQTPIIGEAAIDTRSPILPKAPSESFGSGSASISPSDFEFKVQEGSSSEVLKHGLAKYRKWFFWKKPSKDYDEAKVRAATSAPSASSSMFRSVIDQMFSIFTPDFEQALHLRATAAISSLAIHIHSEDESLTLATDYSYKLSISATGEAAIVSQTVYGALYGLETFSQLIRYSHADKEKGDIYKVDLLPVEVADQPRYPFRGLLVDTSRHFLPMQSIIDTLDSMMMNKLNVLHWHIVDQQAFPFQSERWPLLSKKGAFAPDHIYTIADVKTIIHEAKLRGIRVIPEFDTPGHTESWGRGYPNIMSHCPSPAEPLDPTNEETYYFLEELYREIGRVFSDEYVHLGGDEVSFDCWTKDPKIKAWADARNITDYAKVEQYFESRLLNITAKLGKKTIVWQELLNNGLELAPDTVVDVWKGYDRDTLFLSTKKGYFTVLSGCWYLDNLGAHWRDFYGCEIENFGGTPAQNKFIAGGHAAMWAENVDISNFFSRVYPRASALAERLWSPREVTDQNDMLRRLNLHRCRMVRRGVPVEPLGPSACEDELAYVSLM